MNKNEGQYLIEEIMGEGSLFITYSFLNDKFKWDLEKFEKIIRKFGKNEICSINFYDEDGKLTKISVDDLDFRDLEDLKNYSFLPERRFMKEYENYYG